jgi:hypothetical protein
MALAVDPSPITTPGWMYGRGKCAPWSDPASENLEECRACCQKAVDDWELDANQLGNCLKFCDVMWKVNG